MYVRRIYSSLLILLACGLAQADTIPTLTLSSALGRADWSVQNYANLFGSDMSVLSPVTFPFGPVYPCSPSVPAGGCIAPGPALFLHADGPYVPQYGNVTIGGVNYSVNFEGNAQIQYSTPTIVYPDPTTAGNTVQIPVVLSGLEKACLVPPNPSVALGPCADYLGTPSYPNYIANVSINVPGTLTIYAAQFLPGRVSMQVFFNSTPVPEPGSIVFASLALLVLLVTKHRMQKDGRRRI